tara:strand:- start:151 stop:999 length:849 start_codon:yes stop_codon:yes gene_type:complete
MALMSNALRRLLTSKTRWEAEKYITSQTRSQYLGQNRVLCSILGGKKFFAFGDDIGFSTHMIFDGFWEYWLTKCFADHINEGDVVLDVGANLGYYTLLAGDLVGQTGKVVAIEPNPAVFQFMSESVAVNGYSHTTDCVNAALTDDTSGLPQRFFCPKAEPKNGRFVDGHEIESELKQRGDVFDVETLNDLGSRFDRLDFVKIDVEGAELQVLNMLRPLLQKYTPKVVCECNFGRGYAFAELKRQLNVEELFHLDFDSEIVPLTQEMVDTQRLNDDWLVCLNF